MGKERDVTLLLRDYRNDLPSGPQESFVEVAAISGDGSNADPLTSEGMKRMNKKSLVGETYYKLDIALNLLNKFHTHLYDTIRFFYLEPDAGHGDVEWYRGKAKDNNLAAAYIIKRHDEGIKVLANYLRNSDLYVRYPYKGATRTRYESLEVQNHELYVIYLRYLNDGFSHDDAVEEAAKKMDYENIHAERVISERNSDVSY